MNLRTFSPALLLALVVPGLLLKCPPALAQPPQFGGGPMGRDAVGGPIPDDLLQMPNLAQLRAPDAARPTDPAKDVSYDILNYVKLINAGQEFPGGDAYLYGSRTGYFGAQNWARGIARMQGAFQLQVTNINVIHEDANTAQVVVTDNVRITAQQAPPEIVKALGVDRKETLDLKLAPDPFRPGSTLWQIVPPAVEPPMVPGEGPKDLIGFTAFHLAQLPPHLDAGSRDLAAKRLALISTAATNVFLDWDHRYAFDNANARLALLPYLKTADGLNIPGTERDFTFNDQLANTAPDAGVTPASLVLFYDGSNQQLNFSFEGKAAVLFADGHVAFVTPEEARQLVWRPTPPPAG